MNENAGQVSQEQKKKVPVSTFAGIVCTNSGQHFAPVYKRVYCEKSDKNLVKKVDETDLYEFIQASKSSTDLAVLQKRFLELGEIPNVDPNMVCGVDTTIMPSDIHQLYNMVNDVAGNFAKLPESVRNVFGSSEVYLQSLMDGSYAKKINDAFTPKQNNSVQQEEKGEN